MKRSVSLHPSAAALEAYGQGRLDDSSVEEIDRHLELCTECRLRVAEIPFDPLLARLRVAWSQSGFGFPGGPGPGPVGDGSRTDASFDRSDEAWPAGRPPLHPAEHPDYEIVRELGRGGMGVVYLARHRLTQRLEVLKVVRREVIDRRGILDRFLQEIRAASQLHHPNIVMAFSAFDRNENLIFAMEYVPGRDLREIVASTGPLPVAEACDFARQAALGLQYAHERGMVHRDIKPSNLIVAWDGDRAVVKVLDFGLAKVTREDPCEGPERAGPGGEDPNDSALTGGGQILGTPDFIAPEQIRDARTADIRADIYSLGCTLYYLLTGQPPFRGDALHDVLQAHHSTDHTPLDGLRADIPAALGAVVDRMMAKDPEQRFSAPAEVAHALSPFARPAGASPTTQPGQGVAATRRQAVTRLAAGAGGFVIAAVILWRWRGDAPGNPSPEKRATGSAGRSAISRQAGSRAEPPAEGVQTPLPHVPADPATRAAEGWSALFNGTDMTGMMVNRSLLAGRRYYAFELGSWTVEDGILVGRGSGLDQHPTFNFLHLSPKEQKVADLHVHLEAMISAGGHGGLILRNLVRPVTETVRAWQGYSVAINGGGNGVARSRTGTISTIIHMNAEGTLKEAPRELITPGRWFTLDVIARGTHFIVWVDGQGVLEWTDGASGYLDAGRLAIRVDGTSEIRIRSVLVRDLSGPTAAEETARLAPRGIASG